MSWKIYIDRSLLANPFTAYLKWLYSKIRYQSKYWGKHLRIGYMSTVYNVKFGCYNWLSRNVIISNSELGDFSYVSDNSVILECTIGKFCSLGPNIRVAPGNHPTKLFVSTHPSTFLNADYCLKNFAKEDHYNPHKRVFIGNDVWIGANAVIVDGVSIGDGAVVAANSVVTKDIAPYEIVGGVPAKHIRYRFSEDQIKELLELKWWDKSYSWLEAKNNLFHDVDYLLKDKL